VPIALLGVALAIDRATSMAIPARVKAQPIVLATASVALAGSLYAAGPLPRLQHGPNDFTNHSAFQGSYAPPRWDRSDARHVFPAFSLRADQVSPFYAWLRDRNDVSAIVEYPFDICNHNDLFYYYQHVHRKRVLAGYCSDPRRIGLRGIERDERHLDSVLSMMSADDMLSRAPADRRIAFRNMVDVTHPEALVASGAGIVVVHKVVMGVRVLSDGTMDSVPVHFTSVEGIGAELARRFGAPVYEDAELACYAVKPRLAGLETGAVGAAGLGAAR
jgi:hypothetical protein